MGLVGKACAQAPAGVSASTALASAVATAARLALMGDMGLFMVGLRCVGEVAGRDCAGEGPPGIKKHLFRGILNVLGR